MATRLQVCEATRPAPGATGANPRACAARPRPGALLSGAPPSARPTVSGGGCSGGGAVPLGGAALAERRPRNFVSSAGAAGARPEVVRGQVFDEGPRCSNLRPRRGLPRRRVLGANALLFLSVNMYGVFVRILAGRSQRKALLQARNCIEDRLRLEDENEKQATRLQVCVATRPAPGATGANPRACAARPRPGALLSGAPPSARPTVRSVRQAGRQQLVERTAGRQVSPAMPVLLPPTAAAAAAAAARSLWEARRWPSGGRGTSCPARGRRARAPRWSAGRCSTRGRAAATCDLGEGSHGVVWLWRRIWLLLTVTGSLSMRK
ncbi:uncharacterized protein LOC105062796 isoform X3 [Camelus bactrianus]|uniref:Uncharacterized protein LOC105062796 isoform X3 n=1 Tax=Camelus bactrianus TaxID=9837 RepID=A0AC58P7Z1_CAMBA